MQIALKHGKNEAQCNLDPSSVIWIQQNIGAHFCFYTTKLNKPFEEIFVKRWENQKAPGHDVLLSYHSNGIIPYTPPFLGYACDNNWHYYVFMKLRQVINLDRYTKNKSSSHQNIVTRELIQSCLKNLIETFSAINKRGFYYADFDYKNMMANFKANKVFLIDMDSCVNGAYSIEKMQNAPISFTWWALYKKQPLSNNSFVILNQTMVMSFTLVWCKALAQIESGIQENVAHILRGRPSDQEQLFLIFKNGDIELFKKTYNPDLKLYCQIPLIFSNWHHLLDKMQTGQAAEWTEIGRFVYQLLSLSGKGANTNLTHIFKSLLQRLSKSDTALMTIIVVVFFSLLFPTLTHLKT